MKRFAILCLFLFLTVSTNAVSFSRFSSIPGFPRTNISGITQDTRQDIWITSADGGVFRYDGYNIWTIDAGLKASGVFADSSGRVFIGTTKSIYRYSPDDGLVVFSNSSGFSFAEETWCGDIFFAYGSKVCVLRSGCDSLEVIPGLSGLARISAMEYAGGKIFLGTREGGLYELDPGSLKMSERSSFQSDIRCLLNQDEDLIMVSNYRSGVSSYRISTGQTENVFQEREGLSFNTVQSMLFENDSTLWLGTYDGLRILNTRSGKVSSFKYDSSDESSLSHNSVKVLFSDKQGGIWVGTYYGGVCYYHKSRNRFRMFTEGTDSGHLNDNVVSCIYETPDGTLWIGTNGGGINEYDRTTGKFRYYRFSSRQGVPFDSNDVKAFYSLPDGRHMLIGLYHGDLSILDRLTGNIRHLNSLWNIVSISPQDEDHLILHSYTRSFQYCISTGDAYELQEEEPAFRGYSFSDIIPGVKIASELRESDGVIWYSTDNGLYRYVIPDSSVTHYPYSKGLVCEVFNPGAACLGRDGTIYFGGVGGVTFFNPEDFRGDEPCPQPIIRSITVNGKKLEDWESPFRLKSSNNHIAFQFSVPDYISVRNNTYKYKLEGCDRGWVVSNGNPTALYPNLPPGKYRFKLMVSRNNSEWVECGNYPEFRVLRPWYSSVLGLFIEILAAALALAFTMRSFSRRKKMEQALALKEMEDKYKREISKLKALKLMNTELKMDRKTAPVIDDLAKQDELFLTKAMSIVENNLSNENFSAEMFARKMGMSRVSLYTKIKEVTGKSALDFIHKIRFTEACRLLEEGNLTISEIGYSIGIKDPSYFSTSFKKAVGCSPREYISKMNHSK